MLPAGDEEFDGQSEQTPGPEPGLYWLMMQIEHVSPFAPVYPKLHSQAVFVMLPAGDEEFDGQSEQIPGPKPALYWFLLHGEHMPLLSTVYPALHKHPARDMTELSLHSHAVIVVLPAGETVSNGQSEQLADPKPALY